MSSRVLGGLLAALLLSGCAALPFGSSRDARLAALEERRARLAEAELPKPARPTLEERLAEADRQLAQGDESHAVWNYLEAARQNPDDPTPRARIGYTQVARNPERAEAIFSSLVSDHPDSAEAHAGLGLARFAQDRIEEARTSLERAVELDPDSPTALYWLAVVYDLLDRPDESRSAGERAYALSPKDARIVNNLGVSHLTGRDYVSAERAFRSAILLDPDDPALHNNLGLALGHQGRYDEAFRAFTRFGSEQAAHNNLGYLYYLNGDFAKAVEHYEKSLQSEGGDRLVVLKNLNAALEAMNRH